MEDVGGGRSGVGGGQGELGEDRAGRRRRRRRRRREISRKYYLLLLPTLSF